MTNQPLTPNDSEPVSENAEIEPAADEIWAELSDDEKSKGGAPDEGPSNAEDSQSEADKDENPSGDDPEQSQSSGNDGGEPTSDEDPALKVKSLEEKLERKDEYHRRQKAQVSALQRKLNALEQQMKSAPSRKERKDEDDPLKSLATDYPEIEAPLRASLTKIDKRFEELTQAEQARLNNTKQEFDATQQELVEAYQENSRIVDEYHPDRIELFGTPEKPGPYSDAFQQWVMHPHQSVAIREAALSNAKVITDPQAAAWVIAQFKSYVGQQQAAQQPPPPAPPTTQQSQPNDRRERQRQGASAPRNGGRTPTVSGIPEDGDTEQLWDAIRERERRQSR